MPSPEHLDVPLMGWAIEGSLLTDGGGTFVQPDVFLVGLAAPRTLREAAVRHGRRVVLHVCLLRLLFVAGTGMYACVMCSGHRGEREFGSV